MLRGLNKLLLLVLIAASSCLAQSFRVGVEGGVPLTNSFDTGTATVIPVVLPPTYPPSYSSHTKRYVFGATAELGLPFHLAIKVDALYRRLGFDSVSQTGTPVGTTTSATTANSFEFPVLAKVSIFRIGLLSPYVEGGVAFRNLQGVTQTSSTTCSLCATPGITKTTTHHPSELANTFTKGIVAGAGVEVRHLPLGVFGEIRYTHWTADAFSSSNGLLKSVRDQADLLVGVTF